MTSLSRQPAISGAAQVIQRVDDPREALEPIALMEKALRRAADDAGAPKLLESLDAIYVPRGLWRYQDPGSLLAERVGSAGARTGLGAISGHIVQILVDRACEEIARGRADAIAIVGAESENSKRRLARKGLPPGWNDDVPGRPDRLFGEMKIGILEDEAKAGITNAVSCFSLCETALRHALGESPAEHRRRISELYARMSAIAAKNPYAWLQEPLSAEAIATPSPGNRMVGYPYTKLMTSNISVDQGAALILCSSEAAARFGIPSEKLVYLRAATEMSHTVTLSERDVLHRHAGQEIAARRALELVGIQPEELDYVDLYSCFPFAVQAGAAALGIALDPVPSLTGGMTFAGGPFANYVLQAKATLVERLRADPGSLGAIGSVGGYFAHFAYGLYSADPGDSPIPLIEDVSASFAKLPTRAMRPDFEGCAQIEAYSVEAIHSGPTRATFAALTDAGERVWGRSEDPALLAELLADEEACGREARFLDGLVELD
jgi:acetyl-CoA C-acetyltransferase